MEFEGYMKGWRHAIEIGVVTSLSYVESKCQDLTVRTRAVSLLFEKSAEEGWAVERAWSRELDRESAI